MLILLLVSFSIAQNPPFLLVPAWDLQFPTHLSPKLSVSTSYGINSLDSMGN